MDKTRLNTRHKLKSICDIEKFEAVLNKAMLADKVKNAMRMHYIEDNDFRFIGDSLGYSEGTIKRWHKEALDKLFELL